MIASRVWMVAGGPAGGEVFIKPPSIAHRVPSIAAASLSSTIESAAALFTASHPVTAIPTSAVATPTTER